MSNQQIQIAELNSICKATLGRSEIHGIGVIATRKILKGEKIYADKTPQIYNIPYSSLKQLFPEVRKIILDRWPSIINGSKFCYPDTRLMSFINHSEDPNYNPYKDEAIRDISAGAEIFENYKLMPNHDKVWPDIEKWQIVTRVEESPFQKSLNAVLTAIRRIKNFART